MFYPRELKGRLFKCRDKKENPDWSGNIRIGGKYYVVRAVQKLPNERVKVRSLDLEIEELTNVNVQKKIEKEAADKAGRDHCAKILQGLFGDQTNEKKTGMR